MLFPTLRYHPFGYVNLDTEARRWIEEQEMPIDPNPLLNPKICEDMVRCLHKKYKLAFSYGGWLENRAYLWRGSYLEKTGSFIHLGVDLNVPAGTPIAASHEGRVVLIDNDHPEEHGWGPRVIIHHDVESVYLIYAHLDPAISCRVGDELEAGQEFARIGKAPLNGNWFPHLHVQAVDESHGFGIGKPYRPFDGYGHIRDIAQLARWFPDPLRYISLI